MTTTPTAQKTDRQRFYQKPPKGARFLDDYFGEHRNEAFVEGLKAFAHEWFREYSDEQNLPRAFYELVDMAEDFCWDVNDISRDPVDGDEEW